MIRTTFMLGTPSEVQTRTRRHFKQPAFTLLRLKSLVR
jgi:hypothetical protein